MNNRNLGLAAIAILLIVAVGYNLYFNSAPPRILPKFLGIDANSLPAQVILIIAVVVVVAIGYVVARSFSSQRTSKKS
jgi:cell division protein FtsX